MKETLELVNEKFELEATRKGRYWTVYHKGSVVVKNVPSEVGIHTFYGLLKSLSK